MSITRSRIELEIKEVKFRGNGSARDWYASAHVVATDLGGRKITAIPAVHTVPAVGFHLESDSASLVFSGDTTINDALWEVVNRIDNLRYLIIETAFSDNEKELAVLSKHLCPSMLAGELQKFRGGAEVYITHLKPGELELTMRQVEKAVHGCGPIMLLNNQEFEF